MKLTIGLAVLGGVAGLGSWLALRGPASAPPSSLVIEKTAARLARGKYLFEVVADCEGCHSERDIKKFTLPVIAGRHGSGAVFAKEIGLPGTIVARNISSDPETGLGNWTDGEIIRAIREGVSRDGRALFPMMPYRNYAKMSDEDVKSLVTYLRTLPPVHNVLPRSKVDFPVNLFMQSAPQPVTAAVAPPNRADPVSYGRYLATVGGCANCHSKQEKGEPIEGMQFAGAEPFRIAGFEVLSANITPDNETGIGSWTEQRFVEKFKGYANFNETNLPPNVQANFTLMPWMLLRNMPDEDLRALYAFLRTVKPVRNKVVTHPLVASQG